MCTKTEDWDSSILYQCSYCGIKVYRERMSAVMKCIKIAPYGHDRVQVSKEKSSAMENTSCVRQDFDTGSKWGPW